MKTRSQAGSNKHKPLVGNISQEGSLKEKGNKKSWESLKEATLRDPLLICHCRTWKGRWRRKLEPSLIKLGTLLSSGIRRDDTDQATEGRVEGCRDAAEKKTSPSFTNSDNTKGSVNGKGQMTI